MPHGIIPIMLKYECKYTQFHWTVAGLEQHPDSLITLTNLEL